MFCEGSGNIEYGSNGVNDVDHIRKGKKKTMQESRELGSPHRARVGSC